MAGKVRVTTKFAIAEQVKGFINEDLVDSIGKTVVEDSIDAMSKGISPVEGARRYAEYKDTSKYPGGRKPNRPVNLFLTGALYRALTYIREGKAVKFYFDDPKVDEYAQYLNDGTAHMEQRKILPTEKGEQFQVSIMRKVLAIYRARMDSIINKSNK